MGRYHDDGVGNDGWFRVYRYLGTPASLETEKGVGMKMRQFREKLVEVLGEPDVAEGMKDSFVSLKWDSFQVNIYGIWDDSECWIIDIYDGTGVILGVDSVDAVLAYAKERKDAETEN